MIPLLLIILGVLAGFMFGYFYKESEPNRELISLRSKLKQYERIINNLGNIFE